MSQIIPAYSFLSPASPTYSTMKKIIFFEERGFQGRRYECMQDCPTMSLHMNRCNSIRVEGGAWVVYERPDYKGNMFILEPGEYSDTQRMQGNSERVGSCRSIRGYGSSNYRIKLYQQDDFGGQDVELTDDCPHLPDRYHHREVRSLRIIDGAWVAYDEPHYRGRQYLLEKGEYRRSSEWGASSPTMQSLRCIKRY